MNTVAGFDRHADGTLTPIAGSPFAAGAPAPGRDRFAGRMQCRLTAGTCSPSTPAATRSRCSGSSRDGSLQPVEGSPVSSDGVEPVSIAVHGRPRLRRERRTGASNYTGFRSTPAATCGQSPDSTVALPDGSQPGDVLFNGDGTQLVGTRVGTSLIDSFTVGADGLLTAAPGSPFAAQGLGPFGSEFSPTNPTQLFVSNAHTAAPATAASRRSPTPPTGRSTSIGASPFPDNQTAPCWVEISHDGQLPVRRQHRRLDHLELHDRADGALTLLGSTPFNAGRPRPRGRPARARRPDPLGRRRQPLQQRSAPSPSTAATSKNSPLHQQHYPQAQHRSASSSPKPRGPEREPGPEKGPARAH